MAYHRSTRRHWYFMARTPRAWKQLSTGATDKILANRVEQMWERLAREFRAWDLVEPLLEGRGDILALFDRWERSDHNPYEMRRLNQDCDLESIVAAWADQYAHDSLADTAAHALAHVRVLLPVDVPCPRSRVTAAWLTEQLTAYPGKRNTRRKVHSSWSTFFAYATTVRKLFPVNPMLEVPRPKPEKSPVRFYELDQVERIVAAQPTADRRALMALLYGTAIEVSTALRLVRADVNPGTKEIRAAGTKAHARDRVCRVADWAWPIVWAHIQHHLPTARLFPATLTRWTVSDWHRATVKDLKLPPYPLHNARDHWAATRMRAGTPVALVAAQLGHGTPMLCLTKYGRFLPTAADRARWEQATAKVEAERRKAVPGRRVST